MSGFNFKALLRNSQQLEDEGYICIKIDGYGYIFNKLFNKLYFYWKDCNSDFSKIRVGNKVKFTLSDNYKGKCAIKITTILNFS